MEGFYLSIISMLLGIIIVFLNLQGDIKGDLFEIRKVEDLLRIFLLILGMALILIGIGGII